MTREEYTQFSSDHVQQDISMIQVRAITILVRAKYLDTRVEGSIYPSLK